MCTTLRFGGYFGRNLDLNSSYGEQICILPRQFPLEFRRMGRLDSHYAMIGMAMVQEGYPLWYDACNEQGLAMAGLNFPANAHYFPEEPGKDNVASFELISWVLGQCATVGEVRQLLKNLQVLDEPFKPGWPLSPLHWMVADSRESIVVESVADGLYIYDDPADVLTNNPPFPLQLFNLNNYRHLSIGTPDNTFSAELPLNVYCQGLGALGLPGDVSSMSRFVRAAFGVKNALREDSVSQVFHLLDAVKMLRGCCRTGSGDWDYTVYSSCMDLTRGRYYYTTCGNRQISGVDLYRADLDGAALTCVPLVKEQQVCWQN